MKSRTSKRILGTISAIIFFIAFAFGSGLSASAAEEIKYQKETYQEYYYSKTQAYGSVNYNVSNPGLYNAVYNGLLNKSTTIDVSAYTLNMNDAVNTYFQCLDDHPEIFYADVSVYAVYTSTYVKLNITYLFSGQTLTNEINNFNSKVNSILASVITQDMTPIQKELEIHDYILKNSTYDYNDANYTGGYNPQSHSTYGIIVKGLGVCQSYSKAMKLLLNRVGIECGIVVSDSMNHAWNYVNISGKYYNVDATWDDNVAEYLGAPVFYGYFNQSNTVMSQDHTWVQSDYPASTDSLYEYLNGNTIYDVKWQRSGTDLFYIDSLYHDIYKFNFITGQIQKILSGSIKDFQAGYGKIFFVDTQNNYLNIANFDGTGVTLLDKNAGVISRVEGGFLYFAEDSSGKEAAFSLAGNITSIDIPDTEVGIFVGETKSINVNTNPSGLQRLLSWSGFNTSLLSVNSGQVTGLSNGITNLTASSPDGTISDSCAVKIYLRTDINKDDIVNIQDLAEVANSYNQKDSLRDINGDGIVDIYDLVRVSKDMDRVSF